MFDSSYRWNFSDWFLWFLVQFNFCSRYSLKRSFSTWAFSLGPQEIYQVHHWTNPRRPPEDPKDLRKTPQGNPFKNTPSGSFRTQGDPKDLPSSFQGLPRTPPSPPMDPGSTTTTLRTQPKKHKGLQGPPRTQKPASWGLRRHLQSRKRKAHALIMLSEHPT